MPSSPAIAQSSPITAFVDVNVVPMDSERVLESQTVVVEGDRITAIGPAAEVLVPDGALIIEGNGAYLMPGLADMHTHLQFDEDPDHIRYYLAQGTTTVRNLNTLPEHEVWRSEVANGQRLGPTIYNSGRQIVGLPSYLKSMEYTFRAIVTLTPVLIGLVVWLLLWAGYKITGSPEIFQQIKHYRLPSLAALLVIGGLAAWLRIIPLSAYVSLSYPQAYVPETIEEARQEVRDQKAAGYRFIKVYDFLSEEAYLAALDEARRQNVYAIGHILDKLSVEACLNGGLREIVHVDELLDEHLMGEMSLETGFGEVEIDYDTIPQTVASIRNHDAMVVSNLSADEVAYLLLEDTEGLLAQPQYKILRPAIAQAWKQGRAIGWQGQQDWRRNTEQPFLMAMTKALHDAGVPLLIGTDTSTIVDGSIPYYIHRELELLVEAGLTPFEALEAGTTNANISIRRMGFNDNFGTVEVGQRADLILLRGNPLENVSNTRNRIGVMARGQWFTQEELDALVDEFISSYRK